MAAARAEHRVASTGLGDLKGAAGDGIAIFRGVPYAAPPIDERRFLPPEPAPHWQGLRDATMHGPIAPQAPSRLRLAMGDFTWPQSEDCLTLTISTPAPDGKARPVLVFLHGGAYISGAGSLDWYDGGTLAREGDIVVVGVNYRLGALGWLRREGISEGNLGLLDQAAALAWVRDHIAGFGGDPERVTVAGQSAGGSSIACLLTMPAARPLFRRAIMQSAGLGRPPISPEHAQRVADQLLRALGIDGDAADALQRLRAVPVPQLVETQMGIARQNARFADMSPPFQPVLGGFAGAKPFIAEVARQLDGKELMIGVTREEMHAFFAPDPAMADPDPAAVAERFAALAGDAKAIELYRRRRPGGTVRDLLGDLVTDSVFMLPSFDLAEMVADGGGRVFAYQFDWAPPQSPFKACHCIELPFVFGSFPAWRDAQMLAGGDPAEMAALSALIRRAWIAFVRDGDPKHDGMPPWPAYDRAGRQTMRFASVVGPAGDPTGAAWRERPYR
jgi:para-nitrobenzyl esterase